MPPLKRGEYIYKDMEKDLTTQANTQKTHKAEATTMDTNLLPDFTDIDEVRKAFIASEILKRKY